MFERGDGDLMLPFMRAVERYGMIEPGDGVLLAVSGGKDSLAMLELFARCRAEGRLDMRLHATMVLTDITCSGSVRPGDLAQLCRSSGIPFSMLYYPLSKETNQQLSCYYCSMRRRTGLIKLAFAKGLNCIAMGHHMDDIVETMVMNMVGHGNISTMPPRVDLFGGRLKLIRPLCYVREEGTGRYAGGIMRVPAHAPCPALLGSNRKDTKRFLRELEEVVPGAVENLFGMLEGVAERRGMVAGRFAAAGGGNGGELPGGELPGGQLPGGQLLGGRG